MTRKFALIGAAVVALALSASTTWAQTLNLELPEEGQEPAPAPAPSPAPATAPAPAPASAPAQSGAQEGTKYQDWLVRCGEQGGQQLCNMVQTQVNQETNQPMLQTSLFRLPGRQEIGMLIVLPLGFSLSAGVFMQIDDGEPTVVPVERCVPTGCRIELILDDSSINKLKNGATATVIVHIFDQQGERQRVGIPISLLGFTAAFNEITS